MQMRQSAFAPIVGEDARVLILGTMPSVRSLAVHQYYGHARNAFWPILCQLLGEPMADYPSRCRMLIRHGVALWDVLESCIRPGSADSAIREEVPNDFATFFALYPGIHTVAFNGHGAERLWKRHVDPALSAGREFLCLPATSPAYTIPFEKKYAGWTLLLNALK